LGSGAIPIILVFLLVFLTWQTIYSANRDLVRAKEWGELARRALPFGALLLMALSLFIVQTLREDWVMFTWMAVSGAGIVAATLLSVSSLERGASKAFRKRDYSKAAELYEQLAEEKPLARNQAFLGAALGASESKTTPSTASPTTTAPSSGSGRARLASRSRTSGVRSRWTSRAASAPA
jgi:hypothetical protein